MDGATGHLVPVAPIFNHDFYVNVNLTHDIKLSQVISEWGGRLGMVEPGRAGPPKRREVPEGMTAAVRGRSRLASPPRTSGTRIRTPFSRPDHPVQTMATRLRRRRTPAQRLLQRLIALLLDSTGLGGRAGPGALARFRGRTQGFGDLADEAVDAIGPVAPLGPEAGRPNRQNAFPGKPGAEGAENAASLHLVEGWAPLHVKAELRSRVDAVDVLPSRAGAGGENKPQFPLGNREAGMYANVVHCNPMEN